MSLSIEQRLVSGWSVSQFSPEGNGPHPVLLLIHGWTGDENVMWIFARRLSQKFLMIAPRGLYPSPGGGYGWQKDIQAGFPDYTQLQPSAEHLLEWLNTDHFSTADFDRLAAIGFSQGAALVYTAALLQPERFKVLVGLSGFLPSGLEALLASQPLSGKPVFVAHGSLDELVPVDRARQAVELLEQAGARVSYCEEDVGHRLSVSCFRSMELFLEIQGI